jgi:hypothetical protein
LRGDWRLGEKKKRKEKEWEEHAVLKKKPSNPEKRS